MHVGLLQNTKLTVVQRSGNQFVKNELIYANISKAKADVFIAIVLRCSRWYL